MADKTVALQVSGLAELQRNMKKVNRELPKALRVAFNEAVNVIVDDARPLVPRVKGKAARSIRASSTQTEARIKAGGKSAPYYAWLDFGGRVGRGKSVSRKWLGAPSGEGRYIYPSLRRNRQKMYDILADEIGKLFEAEGYEVDS